MHGKPSRRKRSGSCSASLLWHAQPFSGFACGSAADTRGFEVPRLKHAAAAAAAGDAAAGPRASGVATTSFYGSAGAGGGGAKRQTRASTGAGAKPSQRLLDADYYPPGGKGGYEYAMSGDDEPADARARKRANLRAARQQQATAPVRPGCPLP